MADVYLTQRDIDYISRVVATEVPASLAQSDPAEYSRMVGAVVDTITNRMASGEYPSTVTGVVNQRNQFSAINGPIAGAYGRVQNAPKASPELQSLVASHIADISQGVEESEIGGSMNYANPNFSSAKNLRDWINPMIEAGAVKLGIGDSVHYHGIIPGDEAVGPYSLSAEGIPTTPNVAVPVDNPMKGLLSVVDPYDPNANLRTGTLMAPVDTTWQDMAQANIDENQKPSLIGPNVDILSASTQPIGQPAEVAAADDSGWGLNRDVAPALVPALNSWAPVAEAKPVQAPMDSVTATGILASSPALAADAKANPMMSLAAEGLLGTSPGLSANATVSGLPEVASVSSRMGVADPNMDQSRLDSYAVSVAPTVDASRFSTPGKTSRIVPTQTLTDTARMNPLSGVINPATNTQSFMGQPVAAADLGIFADAYAAQRGPTSGLLSADAQTIQGMAQIAAEKARLDPQLNSFPTSYNVSASGLLAANSPLAAQAVANVPAQTVQTPTIDNAVTGSVTPGLLSPTSIAAANVPMSFTAPTGIIPGQPVQQNAFVDSFPSAVATNTIEPATVNDVVAAPTLDTIQISEQPTIANQMATVEGPATTSATDQQKQAAKTEAAPRSIFDGLLSKETAIGGLLGGALAGVPGAAIGALAGQQVNRAGGLASMFGSSPMSINSIGSGPAAAYSVWNGAAPGTQATASDGQTITAMPGGYTAVTGKYGTTTVFDNNGKAMSYFGSALGTDQDEDAEASTSSGGFFGGLFD
jgi:hypothetical protein